MLEFTVTEAGAVADAKVLELSGYDDLDAAAIDCVDTWTYKPARLNGQLVAAPLRVIVVWALSSHNGSVAPPVTAAGESLLA